MESSDGHFYIEEGDLENLTSYHDGYDVKQTLSDGIAHFEEDGDGTTTVTISKCHIDDSEETVPFEWERVDWEQTTRRGMDG